jgi:hypothetical protein
MSSFIASDHRMSSGGHNRPVPSGCERSMTVSVGPPELTAKTGRPHAMDSRGTIPKCSFDGVYSNARVLGEVRRYDL